MRVLITTNHLRDFAGSEIVTYELIEHFLARGWIVDVYTHDLGEPILGEIQKLPAWGRLTLHVADLAAEFEHDYDLVWVQHSILPPGLLRRLEGRGLDAPMVWHHLSSFMDVELPRHSAIETQLAAVSTGMSGKTVESIREFGLPDEKLLVFDNPAPDAFADFVRPPGARLNKVLVVSNHAPVEIREAGGLLESEGIAVTFLGAADGPVRITPDILNGFDAVITIGKTVQYSLSMGIPVYLYDHFGGPGWLSADNLEPVAYDSFSGRGNPRQIPADEIVREIVDGFDGALEFATRERTELAERWRLSRRIDELLADDRLTGARTLSLSSHDARQLSSLIALHRDLYRLMLKLQGDVREGQRALTDRRTISPRAVLRRRFRRPARWLRSLLSRG
jgi:hypothetical protein